MNKQISRWRVSKGRKTAPWLVLWEQTRPFSFVEKLIRVNADLGAFVWRSVD